MLQVHGPGSVSFICEKVDHGDSRAESRFEFLRRIHFDDLHANGAHRRIVHIARVLGDNYFVFRKAGQVGNAHVQIRVATCNTRGGCMRQPRRTSGRHHAPFCLREFPKTFADGVHQFVKLNVML